MHIMPENYSTWVYTRSYALFIRFHGHPPYRTYVLNLTFWIEIDDNKVHSSLFKLAYIIIYISY